jgi:hypothetical protein
MPAEERVVPVRAVTRGPKAHFFGYYDKPPWDVSGRRMLALEAEPLDRMPGIRCDLHPRWGRDGRAVCIDSAHEGARQMYVLDVSGLVR